MPSYNHGIYVDIIFFILPFASFWVFKTITNKRISVVGHGLIILGTLCLFTQKVLLKFGIEYEGLAAITIGILYIVGGSLCIYEFKSERKK